MTRAELRQGRRGLRSELGAASGHGAEPEAWLGPELVTASRGLRLQPRVYRDPSPLGAVGREWGPQARPPKRKRFSRTCQSCCRLLHPRPRWAGGQRGFWRALPGPCTEAGCWQGREPGSEGDVALAPRPAPRGTPSLTWRRGPGSESRSSWRRGRCHPGWRAGRRSSPGRGRGPARTWGQGR